MSYSNGFLAWSVLALAVFGFNYMQKGSTGIPTRRTRTAILLAAVLAVWGFGFYAYQEAKSPTVEWHSTTARVILSTIQTAAGNTYLPRVFFEYEVDGERFVGDGASLNLFANGNKTYAEEAVTRFPLDHRFTIFFNPKQPSQASLRRILVRTTERQILSSILLIMGSLLGLTLCMQLARKVTGPRSSGCTRVVIDDVTGEVDPIAWSENLTDVQPSNRNGSGRKNGKSTRTSGVHT